MPMNYDIFTLRLPLPFALDHVNVYAIGRPGEWYFLDAGLNTPETRSAWQHFLQEHRIHPGHVKGILITHHHPDHYGATGWLQELCQTRVFMSAEDIRGARLAWHNWEQNVKNIKAYCRKNGAPESLLVDLESNFSRLIPLMKPFPEVEAVAHGDLLAATPFALQVIQTAGHSDGHIGLFEPEARALFSGDHLLPDITTNIGLWAETASVDPLGDYLYSLDVISELDIQRVYPAHGAAFSHPHRRILEMLHHHRQRLLETQKYSRDCVTAYRISIDVFGPDLSPFESRLALAETLAHLNYLEYRSEVRSYDVGSLIVYDRH